MIFAVFASVFFAIFWQLRRTHLEGHIFCISVLSIAPGGFVLGWKFLFNKKAASPSFNLGAAFTNIPNAFV